MLDVLSAAFASAMAGASDTDTKPSQPNRPELDANGVLARLRAQARLFEEANPFKVGDLVTPRADGDIIGAGDPAIIVEVLVEPIELRDPTAPVRETTTQAWGRRLDVRFSVNHFGTVASFLAESQGLERWTPEHEKAWRTRLAEKAAGPKPLSLPEIMAELRDRAAGKKVEAAWKAGDFVEIVGQPERKLPAMAVDGIRIGIVDRVDPSDGTTGVIYHSAQDGKITGAWFRNRDLRKHGMRTVN